MAKRIATIVVIVACIMARGLGLSTSTGTEHLSQQTAADEIISLEKASFEAWQRKDKKFYSEYWADDFSEFLPQSADLTSDPKANILPNLERSFDDWNLVDIQMHDPRVRFYGNVAVLTYTETVQGKYKGEPVTYTGKVTMVYVRANGKWRGVHYHESQSCGRK